MRNGGAEMTSYSAQRNKKKQEKQTKKPDEYTGKTIY